MTATNETTLMDVLLAPGYRERLERLAAEHGPKHGGAHPFAHTVIDDFLPEPAASALLAAFPDPGEFKWMKWEGRNEKKLAWFEAETLAPAIRDVLLFCNTSVMLRFLEDLTGIKGLLPDPYFYGGGMHQIVPGGFLEVHADFNRQLDLNIERRLNLLIYLNKDWREDYGGHLELWETDMSRCARRILPIFNRCVVFNTDATSYHGHPHPLTCPEGNSRKSIALYYYTATLAGEAKPEAHSTIFRERPQGARAVKQLMKRLVPPIVLDVYRRLKG